MTRKNDDEYGTTDALVTLRFLEEDETITLPSRNVDCPDCAGLGVGCCINADIPLPGTER